MLLAGVFALSLVGAGQVFALDFFTLWRQPKVPLRIQEGAWVEYRTQVMAGGRGGENLTRLACMTSQDGSDDKAWIFEIIPMLKNRSGQWEPVAGEGLRLRVARDLLERKGRLIDAVLEVEQWQEGRPLVLAEEQWRDDPLVASSFAREFQAQVNENQGQSTRVVQGRQFLCDQFFWSAADTQIADLPAGRMIQETSREVTAAVHQEIPFLGLVYVTERVRSESRLDPPSRRFAPPPPQIRVEVMELMSFGQDARSLLRRP